MELENNWRNRTLETLEKESWGNPDEAPTNLVRRCILLSKVPVCNFSVEDLRLMIGQQFGLPYLIPLAIERLSIDLFSEGDLYRGDLLNSVLSVEQDFWQENKNLWLEVDKLIFGKEEQLSEEDISISKFNSIDF